MDDELRDMQNSFDDLARDIKENYERDHSFRLRDIILAPFRAIKKAIQFIADSIALKMMVPKNDRAGIIQDAINEERKKQAAAASVDDRKPDARVQALKKDILEDKELDNEQKLRKLCALCMESGKDITVALSKNDHSGKNDIAPDAVIVFEKRGESVQISYAEKEYKTKNAEPSYNLTIKGGMNFDDHGKMVFESLKEITEVFKAGFEPDLNAVYIDKDNLKTESSKRFAANYDREDNTQNPGKTESENRQDMKKPNEAFRETGRNADNAKKNFQNKNRSEEHKPNETAKETGGNENISKKKNKSKNQNSELNRSGNNPGNAAVNKNSAKEADKKYAKQENAVDTENRGNPIPANETQMNTPAAKENQYAAPIMTISDDLYFGDEQDEQIIQYYTDVASHGYRDEFDQQQQAPSILDDVLNGTYNMPKAQDQSNEKEIPFVDR